MTREDAVKHFENMKWLLGVNNTTVDDIPLTKVIDDIAALLKAQEPIEVRLNLCESCTKEYAECEADKTDLVYGSGVGNDNIIGCPWYVNRWKAQEPRVMTLDELVMWQKQPVIERDPIYVEYRKGKGFGAPHWAMDNFGFNVATCQDNYKSGVYGMLVRCWTSRPDEKRRAETPWDC